MNEGEATLDEANDRVGGHELQKTKTKADSERKRGSERRRDDEREKRPGNWVVGGGWRSVFGNATLVVDGWVLRKHADAEPTRAELTRRKENRGW